MANAVLYLHPYDVMRDLSRLRCLLTILFSKSMPANDLNGLPGARHHYLLFYHTTGTRFQLAAGVAVG